LKALIEGAAGPITRAEGITLVLECRAGQAIGTDTTGAATPRFRVTLSQDGTVISADPIAAP
jgi:hypothetical protein